MPAPPLGSDPAMVRATGTMVPSYLGSGSVWKPRPFPGRPLQLGGPSLCGQVARCRVSVHKPTSEYYLSRRRFRSSIRPSCGFLPYQRAMAELVFEVVEESDGGYCAECLKKHLHQGDTWDELLKNVL